MLESRQGELTASLERAGVTAKQAAIEVAATIDRAVAFAGWTDKYQSLLSSLNPVAGPHFNFTSPEPMGVVVIVAPKRPALLGVASALLPVIACGNTCVVLASEEDPRTPLIFGESLATSDLPSGVVNILTGEVAEVLPHLARHLEVAALDLHDVSPDLVKSAQSLAAENVKRVRTQALEEGGFYDPALTESLQCISRFVEMKTIWHPAGV